MLVCLDTQILIWGIKEQASLNRQDMIPKTKVFLDRLQEKKARVLIPTVVVAELMLGVPPDDHYPMSEILRRRFIIAPFDLGAAAHYARVWKEQQQAGVIKELQEHPDASKRRLKVDCMIVATALARGVDCIYSEDGWLLRFAEGYIDARRIPEQTEQLDLFSQEED